LENTPAGIPGAWKANFYQEDPRLLPVELSDILKPSATWSTAGPSGMLEALVAWEWLLHVRRQSLAGEEVSIVDCWKNSLLSPQTIVDVAGQFRMILKVCRSGALAWALKDCLTCNVLSRRSLTNLCYRVCLIRS
jgi:hypothetical protein